VVTGVAPNPFIGMPKSSEVIVAPAPASVSATRMLRKVLPAAEAIVPWFFSATVKVTVLPPDGRHASCVCAMRSAGLGALFVSCVSPSEYCRQVNRASTSGVVVHRRPAEPAVRS
jgi:hypothetical protein